MTPKDVFGLIVRTLGLVIFASGLYYLLSAIVMVLSPNVPKHTAPFAAYALYGTGLVALSLYFLRGAPALVRFSYPEAPAGPRHLHDEGF